MSGSTARATAPRGSWRWFGWIAMAAVVVVALAIGTFGGGERTEAERIQALEESIRCPSCKSQSVANSETPSAKGVKVVIRERIAAGDTDEEIRDYVASRYPDGRQMLLDPAGSGLGALLWGVPVAAAIVAVAALVMRFRDWRPGDRAVTADDRELVADALARTHDGSGSNGERS